MNPQQFREIAWNGLWKQNTGLAQLLGLCPILAVSTSMVNAVSLGLAGDRGAQPDIGPMRREPPALGNHLGDVADALRE